MEDPASQSGLGVTKETFLSLGLSGVLELARRQRYPVHPCAEDSNACGARD